MTRFGWMVLLAVGGAALVLALALGAIGLSALRALFVGVNLATMPVSYTHLTLPTKRIV